MEISEELRSELTLLRLEYEKIQEYVDFEIFSVNELEKGQIGYSIDPGGNSLISGDIESWNKDWVVIGYETLCGDPIVIDLSEDSYPVFSLMHGMGSWEGGTPISGSITSFLSTMLLVNQFIAEKIPNDCSKKFSPKEINILTDRVVNQEGYIYLDSWESLFDPLLDIGKSMEEKIIAEVKQRNEKGEKISQIAATLGLSTKEVYEYLKALK